MDPKVAIVMGSDSDYPIMVDALRICQGLDIPAEASVLSAHRTPFDMVEFGRTAYERGVAVIIAGAGGAAHLPGMLASTTVLPVIGVPVKLASLDGLDSLLSIVQMPAGVPVATVGVNNAMNAGLLAARILAVGDPELAMRLKRHQEALADASRAKRLPDLDEGS
ncbi:MAG: 5-(carboxyamino)imidazole ribonucleotide mutase [Acidimicrobiales bacterium]